MGQQPMLILILSIVLVGGSVVVGAHALGGENHPKNREIVFEDALSIVADIQLWKLKPAELDGGLRVEGFKGITFRALRYSHLPLSKRVHRTDNGCYQIQTLGEDHHAALIISSPSCAVKDYVAHVFIRGMEPGDVEWQHTPKTP